MGDKDHNRIPYGIDVLFSNKALTVEGATYIRMQEAIPLLKQWTIFFSEERLCPYLNWQGFSTKISRTSYKKKCNLPQSNHIRSVSNRNRLVGPASNSAA